MGGLGAQARMGGLWQQYGLVTKALVIALLLVAGKWFIASRGLELITTLSLLTGLMGAVVFTLAILLAGVLADFKESERLITELAAELERLHADLELAFKDPAALARARAHVGEATRALHENLDRGTAVRMKEINAPLEALDAELRILAHAGGPPNYIIYSRQHVAAVVRMAHRLEGIVETSFVTTAYAIAGLVVATALVAFALTDIEPLSQGLLLYGFGAFLLVGLFLLIRDLDNPFAGHARVDLRPLAKLARRWAPVPGGGRAGEAEADPGAVPAPA